MEIRQLEYFLMVSKVNSFTRAAERLYVSQPAVTNAVRALEDELGIQLFDRNQKQALLTAEGKIFCAHVQKLMNGISNTLEEIHAIKNLSGGVLHVGINALGSMHSCNMLLKNFMESYPNIKILLEENHSNILQDKIMENKLDLAILCTADEKPVFNYQKLPKQELIVCCGRQHRFRKKNSLNFAELSNEPLILLNDLYYRQILEKSFNDPKAMNILIESSNVQTIKNLTSIGCGISILPECFIESDNELISIALEPSIFIQPMIVYKKNRHLSHAANAFIELADKGEI